LGLHAICSHIYREGNCCADKLGEYEHAVVGTIWLDFMPSSLLADFARDRIGLPNYRFP